MGERKPAEMSWAGWVEQQIREAQRRGDFADAARGPIPDLDRPHDPDWWNKALIRREGLDQPDSPLRWRSGPRERLARVHELPDEDAVRSLVQDINEDLARQSGARRAPRIDAEAVLRRWRADRHRAPS